MAKTQTSSSRLNILARKNIKQKLSLTSDGIVQEQKGDVYVSLTVDENEYLMPLICTDSYGNYQKIVRTSNVDDTIEDVFDVQINGLPSSEGA